MHEKTLLYSALGVTAIAAVVRRLQGEVGHRPAHRNHAGVPHRLLRGRERRPRCPPPHRLRRHRAQARVAPRRGSGRGSARAHRAPSHVREPGGPRPRGHVPHHAAAGRVAQPLRDEDRRRLAGGRGRREAGGAPRLRGLPPPQAGPGAAWSRARATSSRRASSRSPRAARRRSSSRTAEAARGRRAVRAAAPRPARSSARSTSNAHVRRREGRGDGRQDRRALRAPSAALHARRRLRRRRRRRSRAVAGLRSGDLAIARVVPFASSRPEPVDVRYRARRHERLARARIRRAGDALEAILAQARRGDTQRSRWRASTRTSCPSSKARRAASATRRSQAIIARGALGASDFEQALALGRRAGEEGEGDARRPGDRRRRHGGRDRRRRSSAPRSRRSRRRASSAWTRSRSAASATTRFLRTVVRGVLDRDGVVLDAKLGADALARRLGEATSSGVAVKVEGAKWSWPAKLDGAAGGRRGARLRRARRRRKPVKIDVGGQPFAPDLRDDRAAARRARVGAGENPEPHRGTEGVGRGDEAADRRALDAPSRALAAHRAARPRDRRGLRALRHRPHREGRHPHRSGRPRRGHAERARVGGPSETRSFEYEDDR